MNQQKEIIPSGNFIIIKWPRACVACGEDIPQESRCVYRLFEDKEQDDLGHSLKVPARLYICEYCVAEIQYACTIPSQDPEGHDEITDRLKSDLYGEFIRLDGTDITISEGPFLEKLLELNPDLSPKRMSNPLFSMREKMPERAVITNRDDLPTLIASDLATGASESGQFQEPGESVSAATGSVRAIKEQIDQDPLNYKLWMDLAVAYAKENRCHWARDSLVRARDLAGEVGTIADALEECREICGSVIDEGIDSW